MPTFKGSITSTGKSEAIRLDKALFQLHPEFRQKAKVRAQVISPGHALITAVDDKAASVDDEDPVVTAFLASIERDLTEHPGRRSRLSRTSLQRAVRLTKGVKVDDDETLPEDVTRPTLSALASRKVSRSFSTILSHYQNSQSNHLCLGQR